MSDSTTAFDRSRAAVRRRFFWALSLPFGLLALAVWRVSGPVHEAWPTLMQGRWAGALSLWVIVMAYFEGYRGFQQRVVPTLIRRAGRLAAGTGPGTGLMQLPVAAAALWWAPAALRRRRWVLILALTALILTVRLVPQPWRGLIDAGVLVGLSWGLASLGIQALRAEDTVLQPGDDVEGRS